MSSPDDALTVSRKIRLRYLLALGLIAALVSATALTAQLILSNAKNDASIINIAGQQRMLSQRIALQANRLLRTEDPAEVVFLRRELKNNSERFLKNHNNLTGKNLSSFPLELTPALMDAYFSGTPNLDEAVRQYALNARALASSNIPANESWSYASTDTTKLLQQLNNVVTLFEQEATARLTLTSQIEMLLWFVTMLLLLAEIFLIFRPLENQVVNAITTSQQARDFAEKQQQKAEQASKAKSQFLANMSHELRTPLNGILGMIELSADEKKEATRFDYLNKAKSSGKHLLSIINDILDISKIEAEKLTIENFPFSLHKLLDDCLAPIAILCQKKQLNFEYENQETLPEWVSGDPIRISQVLHNILSNAVKFTPQGTIKVSVICEPAPIEASTDYNLIIVINDSGIGIAEDKLEQIFEKFTQADASTTRRFGGTGLGLNIARELVLLMQGHIEISSEVDFGTEFVITIPLQQVAAPPSQVIDNNAQTIKVAIIDDLASSRQYLSLVLERAQVQVVEFDSGVAFIEQLKHNNFAVDVVIIDFHMPELDGLETVQLIREQNLLPNIPFILISAASDQYIFNREQQNWFRAILTKPVDESHLLGLIAETLQPVATKRSLNVLIAEDNKVSALVVIKMVEKLGHQVTWVKDGVEVVDALTNPNTFDLVLMDINMPNRDGYQAANIIRQEMQLTIPIVALTANAFREDVERAKANGMNEHLSKPIIFEKLQKVLDGFA